VVIRIKLEDAAYISPSSLVDKKNGEKRKIIDLRVVNFEQLFWHFRMDTPVTVQLLALPGDWATSLDLKSAFNHLRVSKEMRPFLCFMCRGDVYTYRAMPFGARHSPRLFTEVLGYALRYIRAHWEVRVIAYMDDILLLHQDPVVLERSTLQIAVYLGELGWTLSTKKCEFTPKQVVKYIGWHWSFRTLTVCMTAEIRTAMLKTIMDTFRKTVKGVLIPCKRLGVLIGSLNFLRVQIPRASL
jgi:hypothetical protein